MGEKRTEEVMGIIKNVKIKKIVGGRSTFILGIDQSIVE